MKLLRQICILISLVSINLSGCDKVAELLPGASEDGKQAKNNTVEEENYVQGPLLVIFDDQEMLFRTEPGSKKIGRHDDGQGLCLKNSRLWRLILTPDLKLCKGS